MRNRLVRWKMRCILHCFLGLFGRVRRRMLYDAGMKIFEYDGEYNEFPVFRKKLHRFVGPIVSYLRKGYTSKRWISAKDGRGGRF